MARSVPIAVVSCIAMLGPTPLTAQTPTAAVTGVVQDSQLRALAGVEVRALSIASGLAYRALSSATGRYWLRGLPPGRYDITARQIGLRTTTVRNVELSVGHTVGVDFTLRPSAVELEPLTVDVGAPLIETTRSEISYVLDRDRIEQLPEESRQFIELAQLVPGVTAGTDATGGPPPFGTNGSTVGALNRQSLGVLVDGGDFTEAVLGDLSGSLPLLAVQEFEVVQAQYSPELGRAASGIVNVVTRRGGNDLTVDAFGLYRHQALNARGAFEAEKPDFNRSHWGVAVGGPIVAGRTHLFAAFEHRVQNDFSTVNTGGAFPEYEGTFKTPFTDNLMFARLDHRVSDAHELSLRYAGEVGEQLIGVGGREAFEHGRHNSLDMHSGLLTHRWAPGGTVLNEARLHVIDSRRSLERNAPPGPTLVYPGLVAGPHPERARLGSLRLELRNDLSWIAAGRTGTHRLKLGAHLSWQENAVHSTAFDNGYFEYTSDTASRPVIGLVTLEDGGIRLDARNLQLAVYVQDDWNPVPRLTLNLGLRYDVETNGSNQGFVSPFAGALPFIPTTAPSIDWNNLAPRLGLAWDPTGDGRTVVRAGFGIFYDALVAGPLVAFEQSSGLKTAVIPFPGTTDLDSLMIDPSGVAPMVWTHGDIETPMTRQYSVGVQHTLPGDLVVRADGLLVQGRNLLLQRNLNPIVQVTPTGIVRAYDGFANILRIESEGKAEAWMLLMEVRRTFPRGWFSLGYTLADRKTTNDTWGRPLVPATDPDSLDLEAEWGPAAWDEQHRLVATGGVVLPFDLGLVVKAIYSSARPFTAVTGQDDNGDMGGANDRPPGEGRNARSGPDFFRTDLGITWSRLTWGAARFGLVVNVYNLFNTTNGSPSSVQSIIGSPDFGAPLAAFPGRQMEMGIEVRFGGPRR